MKIAILIRDIAQHIKMHQRNIYFLGNCTLPTNETGWMNIW